MTPFQRALVVVLLHEGGIADHAEDPGGYTVKGITLGFLRACGLDPNNDGVIDKRDLVGLTNEQVERIYYEQIWTPCQGDRLAKKSPGLALAVFDAAVNLGQPRALKLLQEAAGATADGVLGPASWQAIDNFAAGKGVALLIGEFTARRAFHYATRPKVLVFGLGWFRRLVDVHRRALTF